jgi:hypothetical protein
MALLHLGHVDDGIACGSYTQVSLKQAVKENIAQNEC